MPNLPDGVILPGVTTVVETVSQGVSVPSSIRLACLVGTGARQEVIVTAANGDGKDGLNSTYTSTTGRDGRHFTLSLAPIVSNRTQLFKNGIPLAGLEAIPSSTPFDNRYDYRVDIATGHIELQTAHLVDQGGKFYTIGSTNVGLGTLDGYSGPQLVDINAPTETWTVKCISVQRDSLNAPIQQTGKFIAFGSVSGVQTDANGNIITWIANGQQVSNGIIKFAISETLSGPTSISPFREGDFFTIQVKSGLLNKNDTLTANYIAVSDLNDPELFQSMQDVAIKHGLVSLDNTLSLGASLAFANSPPGILALQAAPPMPRRTSYHLTDNVDAASIDGYDFILPLPIGVVPDPNAEIHFFVTDPLTGVEKQLLPNKFPFYTLDTGGQPTTNTFIFSDTNPPGGYSFSYSVNQSFEVLNFGSDGYIDSANTFSVSGFTFTSAYIGERVRIFDATNSGNNADWTVSSVVNGKLVLTGSTSVTESNLHYQVQDLSLTSQYVVINHNIVPDTNNLRVSLVDVKDSTFFDAGWETALLTLEASELDILVVLPQQTISVIFQNALNHCITMSSPHNRKERVLFTGAIRGLTPDNVTGAKPAAVENIGILEGIQGATVADVLAGNTEDLTNYSVSDNFGHTFRSVFFYPDEIVAQVGADNVKIDGFYIAAAAAGFVSGTTNIAMPLTNKILSGFSILRNKLFSTLILEELVNAGIAVLQPVAGGGRVIWGKTTTQSGFPEEEEISVVFIRDAIAKRMRAGFQGFIGLPASADTIPILSTRASGLLKSFVSQNLITDYKNLIVKQDAVDPRQFDVSVLVAPTEAINWILIKIGVGSF